MADEGWGSLRLGEVCNKIGSGATPRGGKEVYLRNGPCALIRSQNVHNDCFRHDGLVFISEKQAAQLENVEVHSDDVLLNITGDSVARACQVAPDILPARVNQHVAIIRPDPTKLSPQFLMYFLVCPEVQAMLLSWAGSGGTRNALTKGMIESFDVRAPTDVNEQRAIAHILGTLDDKIELNRRRNETLEAMARALFKSWFVDFDPVRAKMAGWDPGLPKHIADLFPDLFVDSELGEIPEGWRLGALGDVLRQRVERCRVSEETASRPYVPIDCISPKSLFLTESKLGKEAKSSLTKFYTGDLIFGAMRPYYHKVCIAPFDGTTRTTAFVLYPKRKRDFAFATLLLHDPDTIDFATRNSTGSTIPYAVWTDSLEAMTTIIPTSGVLKAFNDTVRPLLMRIPQPYFESRTLAALRDALLPKLISGELRVKDAENSLNRVL